MKEFVKSRIGRAIVTALSVSIIGVICVPLFDLIFHGGIEKFDVFSYVVEPVIVGVGVGVLEYIFRLSEKREKRK